MSPYVTQHNIIITGLLGSGFSTVLINVKMYNAMELLMHASHTCTCRNEILMPDICIIPHGFILYPFGRITGHGL